MKTIIIGGVAGGASAAARLRRLNEKAQIVVFERTGFVSYANCGLPYYIGGEITDKEELTLQTPASFKKRFNVDVNVFCEVTKININEKTVTVKNLQSGEVFKESYDKLMLSPGAKPVVPEFLKGDRVFTLRTVEDTFRIKEYIESNSPKSAVILGGGFIGLEMAENLVNLGVNTTIIQRGGQLLSVLDKDMASFVHAKFKSKGVKLIFNAKASFMEQRENGVIISGEGFLPVTADMVIAAAGVAPENSLAKDAGLLLGERGAIKVNEYMQTSNEDIYAVGDAVEVNDYVAMGKSVIPLAGPANKQGRIAADNICGIKSVYRGSLGSSVIKLFDMTAACTGINEKVAGAKGLSYGKVILSPSSHAGYYPGAKVMTLKVIYENGSLKILGAQAVGFEGVDKRIDVIATAIYSGLTADRLRELDLAYAPPYSSAKDPVNMAGFIIDNIENGLVKQFYYEDIPALRKRNDITLLDTRTAREYQRGFAEGFINVPVDELRSRLNELDRNKPVYVMCQSALRSYIACRILTQNGFDAYNFAGGYRLYSSIFNDEPTAKEAYNCGLEK